MPQHASLSRGCVPLRRRKNPERLFLEQTSVVAQGLVQALYQGLKALAIFVRQQRFLLPRRRAGPCGRGGQVRRFAIGNFECQVQCCQHRNALAGADPDEPLAGSSISSTTITRPAGAAFAQ